MLDLVISGERIFRSLCHKSPTHSSSSHRKPQTPQKLAVPGHWFSHPAGPPKSGLSPPGHSHWGLEAGPTTIIPSLRIQWNLSSSLPQFLKKTQDYGTYWFSVDSFNLIERGKNIIHKREEKNAGFVANHTLATGRKMSSHIMVTEHLIQPIDLCLLFYGPI